MTSRNTHRSLTAKRGPFDRFGDALPETLVELLRRRAWDFGDECAYRFLGEDGTLTSRSFLDLDRKARAVAEHLQSSLAPGERVLLMFPPGLDFIEAPDAISEVLSCRSLEPLYWLEIRIKSDDGDAVNFTALRERAVDIYNPVIVPEVKIFGFGDDPVLIPFDFNFH